MLTAAPSGAPRGAMAEEQPAIEREVDDHNPAGQDELRFAREPGGIDDRQQVMLDEALRVARLARPVAQVVLRMGQRTDAPGELDEETPGSDRKVNEDRPAPTRSQSAPGDDEDDEGQVKEQDSFSGQAIEHRWNALE